MTRIEEDWEKAGLSDQRTAMLSYAIKLTAAPGDMGESDIAKLRGAGFTDRDIHDSTEVDSYYAYVNRIADRLGVTLESCSEDDTRTSTRRLDT